uniref:Ribosomal RNA methyltransferase FtsJ domain-containing protein n=1 Tax=viral metagenome TaxID=1070528 RepID=A0A6C0L110_9ZZZZ
MKNYRLGIHEKIIEPLEIMTTEKIFNSGLLLTMKCKIDAIPSKTWEITKKMINKYEFIYTSSNRSKNICNIVPVSRSYFKLYEIVHDLQLLNNNIYCACLAEGPGGFIHCLNDIDQRGDYKINKTYGITLKSNDKTIPYWNTSLFNHRNTLLFGEDGTGDLYNHKNIQSVIDEIGDRKCHLVTADGGFDYSQNYNLQEESSYQLLFSEIFTALHIQAINGNFVLKVFDLFHYKTIQLIYLLYNHYSYIEIYKPTTSRLSNSEKYIVCSEFKGMTDSVRELLNQSLKDHTNFKIKVPDSFINEIMKYNQQFVNLQIDTIKTIIQNIGKFKQVYPTQKQITNAIAWCESYKLPINTDCIYLK